MILSPSLLASDFGAFGAELQALEDAGLSWVHWDVMDGVFVPNITFGAPVIKALRARNGVRSGLFFDVHLMIVEPERYLADFQAAGADMLVVHAEATRHLHRTLAEIRRLGMQAGVAINPATPLSTLDWVLDMADMFLVMSVNPGFGGQRFIESTYDKVRALRQTLDARGLYPHIQVDGGVDPSNTRALVEAGADVLVSGSAFFGVPPYAERLKTFEAAALPLT